jgi:hypothetical protein
MSLATAIQYIGELWYLSSQTANQSPANEQPRICFMQHRRRRRRNGAVFGIPQRQMTTISIPSSSSPPAIQHTAPLFVNPLQPQPSTLSSTSASQQSKLSKLSLLPLYWTRFENWIKLVHSHYDCCVNRNKSAVEKLNLDRKISDKPVPSFTISKDQLRLLTKRKQQVHLSEEFTRLSQSIFLKETCTAKNQYKNDTMYVNWTNMFLPGMGFAGNAPTASCQIDDRDELELFWNSDISFYLHPTKINYPLQAYDFIFCKSICVLDRNKTTCQSRIISVLNIALDYQELPISVERQKGILYLVFSNIIQVCVMKKQTNLVLPIGRFIRAKFELLLIAHCFCKIFLPAMLKGQIQRIEVLFPNSDNKQKKSLFYTNFRSVLDAYFTSY